MSLKDIKANLPTQEKLTVTIKGIDADLIVKQATANQKMLLGLGKLEPMEVIATNVRGSDGTRMTAKEWDRYLTDKMPAVNELFEYIFPTVDEDDVKN